MKNIWFLGLVVIFLAACDKQEEKIVAPGPGMAVRLFDQESVARGAKLFEAHCVLCHGPQAQGHPDWETPSDGIFAAAPPLNGTGNDWKRTRPMLAAVIQNGVRRKSDKVDIMPAWKGRINERDIEDMLNWMQSLWPAEVYDTWSKAQTPATTSKN